MTVLISLPAAEELNRLLPVIPSLGEELGKFLRSLATQVDTAVKHVENTGDPGFITIKIYKPKAANDDAYDPTSPLG